jgi:hypothetical protein
MYKLFGGNVLTPQASESDEETHFTEFLGLWGIRKGSRWRRLLRERGAEFTLETKRTWEDRELAVSRGAAAVRKLTGIGLRGVASRSRAI